MTLIGTTVRPAGLLQSISLTLPAFGALHGHRMTGMVRQSLSDHKNNLNQKERGAHNIFVEVLLWIR
jgi:hypothetical protein